MRLSPVVVAVLLMAACGGRDDGATALKASVESIGDEMMALHEPRRVVEYHDRSGKPFWVAFIPPRTGPQALTASGIPPERQCPPSELTTVAVGADESTQCVTFARMTIADLRVVQKGAGSPVQMTLALDVNGYRIVDVR